MSDFDITSKAAGPQVLSVALQPSGAQVASIGLPGPKGPRGSYLTADWPLASGAPASLSIYPEELPVTNHLEVSGNVATLNYTGPGTEYGVGKFGDVSDDGEEREFWFQFRQHSTSLGFDWLYIGVGVNPDDGIPIDGSVMLTYDPIQRLVLRKMISGTLTPIGTVDAGFAPSTDPDDNCIVRVNFNGATGLLTVETADEVLTSTEPQIAGFSTLLEYVSSTAGTLSGQFSLTQLGSIAPSGTASEWVSIDVSLPEVTAPAILTVTDDAPTRYYGGNLYGPKSDTTPGVNHFGFLMPDGVTVIPLPDDAVGRAEVAEMIAAEIEAVTASLAVLLLTWAYAKTFQVVSSTRDSNNVIVTASIVWPNGATGIFTTDIASEEFPGAIDAWHATYVIGPTTKTVSQPAVTRDSNGFVTMQPAIIIS